MRAVKQEGGLKDVVGASHLLRHAPRLSLRL